MRRRSQVSCRVPILELVVVAKWQSARCLCSSERKDLCGPRLTKRYVEAKREKWGISEEGLSLQACLVDGALVKMLKWLWTGYISKIFWLSSSSRSASVSRFRSKERQRPLRMLFRGLGLLSPSWNPKTCMIPYTRSNSSYTCLKEAALNRRNGFPCTTSAKPVF